MYKVYCYTNKINGKKYIGITNRSVSERQTAHIYEATHEKCATYNTPFKRAIRKYGIENFILDILDCVETKEEACSLEIQYISELETYYKYCNSNGYNATTGGELIIRPRDRVLKIDSDYNVVEIYDSVSSAEANNKKCVHECVNSLDDIRTANGHCWLYEKDFNSMSENELILFVDRRLRPLYQIDAEMNIVSKWKGSKEASKALGLNQSNISMCANGKRTKCGGYHWMYCDDYVNHKNIRERGTNKKKILQLSKNGEIIKIYESVTEAAFEFDTEPSCLISSLKSDNKNKIIAYGYVWFYYDGDYDKPFSLSNGNKKGVYSVDEFGNKEYFESASEAARTVGIKQSGIFRSIKTGMNAAKRKWYYSEEEEYNLCAIKQSNATTC